ncbi:uncharacterized protein Bfra_012207 [Botrytis fragariae]|uniref:Uncharacterized protein n=1 Tax=Botrytis fragariae TaxID=1964551 RepID=A0A8H6EE37_9HELO|nr:uncharacterized protein Bfra_012207 [Botrytis fragariae]KAF5868560.1 hypothetical protein Bfra_012207 [Botrytis fragariae]
MSTLHDKRLSSSLLSPQLGILEQIGPVYRILFYVLSCLVAPFAQIHGEKEKKKEVIINAEGGLKLGLRCTKMGPKPVWEGPCILNFPRESNGRKKEKLKRRELLLKFDIVLNVATKSYPGYEIETTYFSFVFNLISLDE